jgi:hypothetical protein
LTLTSQLASPGENPETGEKDKRAFISPPPAFNSSFHLSSSSHNSILSLSFAMSPISKTEEDSTQHHAEDVESQITKPDYDTVDAGADRATQMMDGQHVEVTEEDVSTTTTPLFRSHI